MMYSVRPNTHLGLWLNDDDDDDNKNWVDTQGNPELPFFQTTYC